MRQGPPGGSGLPRGFANIRKETSDADHPKSPRFFGRHCRWPRPRASLAPGDRSPTRARRKRPRSGWAITRTSACAPVVHRRGAAARGRVHRHPLRSRPRRSTRSHGGEIDFDLETAAWVVYQRGCRRADHGVGGCASRLLRAVRARAHPSHQRPEGQAGRHRPAARLRAGICSSRSWRRRSGWIRRRTSSGPPARPQAPWSCSPQGQVDAFLAFPPEPQELRARKIGRMILSTGHRPAMVAVLLLHRVRQPGVRPRSSGRDQALPARHPQGRRHLRHRAGAGRATAGRWRVHASATTTRSRR